MTTTENNKYIVATDSITMTITAASVDAAARAFAASEKIQGVLSIADLEQHVEGLGGWVRISLA